MRVISESVVKVVGFRPYRFRDDQQQKEFVGVTIFYQEPVSEEEKKNGFIGDKVGSCSVPGSHSDLSVGCCLKFVYEYTNFKGEVKMRAVDYIRLSK